MVCQIQHQPRLALLASVFQTLAALIAELARFVQSGAAFIAMRAVIGCGLATFVCCQVWCSQQFSKNVVR